MPKKTKKVKNDIDRSKLRAEISTWKPKKGEMITHTDGNLFIMDFDKVFNNPELAKIKTFIIKKSSYEGVLAYNSKCMNYFIHKYDVDGELITAYYKIKYSIDMLKNEEGKPLYNEENPEALIDLIYELLFTPTMQQKICQLVEDNYLDDIEKDTGEVYKTGANYLESLEFKNEHIKIMLRISFGMKLIAPLMFHYFTINRIKPDALTKRRDISIIYNFYERLFPMFQDDTDIYNKLYVYIKRKVMDAEYHNEKMFKQRSIFGDDKFLLTERFTKKQIISENMIKYKFNENWDPKKKKYDENIIGFNKTIVKYQLFYFRKEIYEKTLAEMTNTKGSDGLSTSDKMEMNTTKLDIGIIDLAEINVESCLERLRKEIDIPITDEEIQYYRDNHYPADVQIHLVRSIYAEYFMSYRDEYLIDRREYNILLLLLKKKLLLEAGYEGDEKYTDAILPYILTGNLEGKVNKRVIRNVKLMAKLDDNPIYQYLVTKKYKELEELKPGYIKELISTFIHTQFSYVCYENPELTGQMIEASEEKICDELLFFLKNI